MTADAHTTALALAMFNARHALAERGMLVDAIRAHYVARGGQPHDDADRKLWAALGDIWEPLTARGEQ